MALHKHDCHTCHYLGTHEGYDLYHHAEDDHQPETFIARFGVDGAYISGSPENYPVGHPINRAGEYLANEESEWADVGRNQLWSIRNR